MATQKAQYGIVVAAVVVVGGLLWWWATGRQAPSPAPAPEETPAAVPGAAQPSLKPPPREVPASPQAQMEPSPVAQPVTEPTAAEEEEKAFIRDAVLVRPDMILARVNGVEIKLKDLMPVSGFLETERSLQTDEFEARLARAVDRELIFQAARVRGVDLGDEQRRQLEKSRLRAAISAPKELSPEAREEYNTKANFDAWELTADMTMQALVAAAGGPPRDVTPEMVEAYYHAHRVEFGELPPEGEAREAAWQKMDEVIRARLLPAVEAEYQKYVQAMLEDLRKRADIQKNPVTAAD